MSRDPHSGPYVLRILAAGILVVGLGLAMGFGFHHFVLWNNEFLLPLIVLAAILLFSAGATLISKPRGQSVDSEKGARTLLEQPAHKNPFVWCCALSMASMQFAEEMDNQHRFVHAAFLGAVSFLVCFLVMAALMRFLASRRKWY